MKLSTDFLIFGGEKVLKLLDICRFNKLGGHGIFTFSNIRRQNLSSKSSLSQSLQNFHVLECFLVYSTGGYIYFVKASTNESWEHVVLCVVMSVVLYLVNGSCLYARVIGI